MKSKCWMLAAIPLILVCGTCGAADWPQWRGPQRNGISPETGLSDQWPENGPRLVWQADDVGWGYSTPSVVGDRLFLIGNLRSGDSVGDESVRAHSTGDGSLIWETRIGEVGNPDQRPPYPGSRSTPTVDGQVLYALGSDGDLVCLETSSGDVRWQKNLRADFGGEPGEWAYSESPLVDGERVVCTPGGKDAAIVALHKDSGEVIWQTTLAEAEEAAYASIVPVSVDGQQQYVQFLSKGLVGVAADSGKVLWRYDRTAEGSPANIPTPVTQANFVYSATGRGGSALIKVGGDAADEVYFSSELPNAIGGAVRVGDYLYGTKSQGLVCLEFGTGEIRWSDRSIGTASICFADGNLYLHGENGDVALVEATPDEYRERGRFSLPDQPDRGRSKAWTYPVIANGRLYLRDMNMLWCYDIAESSSSN
jgi:outer membrane protein assembly factor BamB